MAFYVNNPMTSLRSASLMRNNYSKLSESVSSLSSGLKIQSAADGGPEYATSQLMRSNISTTQQGIRNANDAISLLQIADGAMQIIDEKIIRMKELAEQAATGTYDSVQRGIIDSEYQAMASEITRIANATEFNGIKLLNGNIEPDEFVGNFYGDFAGALKIHYGNTNNSNMDYTIFSIDAVTSEALHLGNNSGVDSLAHNVSTQEGAQNALQGIEAAIRQKNDIHASIGAFQRNMELTINKLSVQAEELQVTESGMVDVDVASEMTEFVKYQTVVDMTGSLITQANSIPKMALELLK